VASVLQRARVLAASRSRLGFDDWRTGDQRYYVSDTRKFTRLTGWRPRVSVAAGLEKLNEWLSSVVRPEAALEREPPRRAEHGNAAGRGAAP